MSSGASTSIRPGEGEHDAHVQSWVERAGRARCTAQADGRGLAREGLAVRAAALRFRARLTPGARDDRDHDGDRCDAPTRSRARPRPRTSSTRASSALATTSAPAAPVATKAARRRPSPGSPIVLASLVERPVGELCCEQEADCHDGRRDVERRIFERELDRVRAADERDRRGDEPRPAVDDPSDERHEGDRCDTDVDLLERVVATAQWHGCDAHEARDAASPVARREPLARSA